MSHEAKYRMGNCRDCGAKTRINYRQLARRAPPRCSACGGMLDMSGAGMTEVLDIQEAKRENKSRLMRQQGFAS